MLQLNAVDAVLGSSIYDLLRIPRYQWSMMLGITSANTSTSSDLFSVLPIHYSTMLPYVESVTVLIDFVSGSTADRLLDNVNDVLLVIVGAAVFLGFAFTGALVLVPAHVLIYNSHNERLLALVEEQRELLNISVLAEKSAVLAKDRFLTVVSVYRMFL